MLRRSSRSLLAGLAVFALPTGAAMSSRTTPGPVLTAGPTVVGVAAAGKHLTGLSGTWAGSGEITYRFQWYRCNAAGAQCLTLRGSTSPTYALVTRDIGKTVGLTVTATDSSGSRSGYTSLIGPIAPARPLLEATTQPTVSGPPVEGKTVAVTTGAWSPTPTKITYSWERCNPNGRICAAIANATGNTYLLTAADVGHALVVLVQGTYGPTSQNTFSTATPAVVDTSVAGPTPVTPASIGGTPVVSQRLAAGVGIWTSVGTIGFAYQWYRCDTTGSHCSSIHGATGPTYRLVTKDAGYTIGLTVHATDSTGTSVAYASLYGPIAPASTTLAATAQPELGGIAKVGAALTASNGSWTMPPTGYTYTWLRCNQYGRLCTPIPAATRASYVVVAADLGHALIADVEATTGAETQSAFSPATAPVG